VARRRWSHAVAVRSAQVGFAWRQRRPATQRLTVLRISVMNGAWCGAFHEGPRFTIRMHDDRSRKLPSAECVAQTSIRLHGNGRISIRDASDGTRPAAPKNAPLRHRSRAGAAHRRAGQGLATTYSGNPALRHVGANLLSNHSSIFGAFCATNMAFMAANVRLGFKRRTSAAAACALASSPLRA
jgi:hypothetical protein